MIQTRSLASLAAFATPLVALAQVPDLLNTLDAGSPSLGAASVFTSTASDTFSGFFNPAGLGYLSRRTIQVAYRNLPVSVSTGAGTLGNLARQSTQERGKSTITHLGFATPLRSLFGRGAGSISVSYTLGGYLNDQTFGAAGQAINIGGGLGIANFRQETLAENSFFTLAYGATNGAQNFSYGLGAVLARSHVRFDQTGVVVDGQGQPQPGSISPLVSRDSNGTGLGAIVGAQFTPPRLSNVSFGISYRTEINLSGNGSTAAFYDKIPARFLVGAAVRTPGLRRDSDDYAVIGVQFVQYFSTGASLVFPGDSQSGAALGVEYVLARGSRRIPIRLGYSTVGSAGPGFERRQGLSYGFGLPVSDKLTIDAAFFRANGGTNDLAITATYRF